MHSTSASPPSLNGYTSGILGSYLHSDLLTLSSQFSLNIHFLHIAFRKAVTGQEAIHMLGSIFQKQSLLGAAKNKHFPPTTACSKSNIFQAVNRSREKSLEVSTATSTDSLLSSCLSSTHPHAQKVHCFIRVWLYRDHLYAYGSIQPHLTSARLCHGGAATPSSGQTGASQL